MGDMNAPLLESDSHHFQVYELKPVSPQQQGQNIPHHGLDRDKKASSTKTFDYATADDIFISFRFGEARDEAEQIRQELRRRGHDAYICDVPGGANIKAAIVDKLSRCRMAIIMGSYTYGEGTVAFCTKEEMEFIISERIPYFLIKMCDDFKNPITRFNLTESVAFEMWLKGDPFPAYLVDKLLQRYKGILANPAEIERFNKRVPDINAKGHTDVDEILFKTKDSAVAFKRREDDFFKHKKRVYIWSTIVFLVALLLLIFVAVLGGLNAACPEINSTLVLESLPSGAEHDFLVIQGYVAGPQCVVAIVVFLGITMVPPTWLICVLGAFLEAASAFSGLCSIIAVWFVGDARKDPNRIISKAIRKGILFALVVAVLDCIASTAALIAAGIAAAKVNQLEGQSTLDPQLQTTSNICAAFSFFQAIGAVGSGFVVYHSRRIYKNNAVRNRSLRLLDDKQEL